MRNQFDNYALTEGLGGEVHKRWEYESGHKKRKRNCVLAVGYEEIRTEEGSDTLITPCTHIIAGEGWDTTKTYTNILDYPFETTAVLHFEQIPIEVLARSNEVRHILTPAHYADYLAALEGQEQPKFAGLYNTAKTLSRKELTAAWLSTQVQVTVHKVGYNCKWRDYIFSTSYDTIGQVGVTAAKVYYNTVYCDMNTHTEQINGIVCGAFIAKFEHYFTEEEKTQLESLLSSYMQAYKDIVCSWGRRFRAIVEACQFGIEAAFITSTCTEDCFFDDIRFTYAPDPNRLGCKHSRNRHNIEQIYQNISDCLGYSPTPSVQDAPIPPLITSNEFFEWLLVIPWTFLRAECELIAATPLVETLLEVYRTAPKESLSAAIKVCTGKNVLSTFDFYGLLKDDFLHHFLNYEPAAALSVATKFAQEAYSSAYTEYYTYNTLHGATELSTVKYTGNVLSCVENTAVIGFSLQTEATGYPYIFPERPEKPYQQLAAARCYQCAVANEFYRHQLQHMHNFYTSGVNLPRKELYRASARMAADIGKLYGLYSYGLFHTTSGVSCYEQRPRGNGLRTCISTQYSYTTSLITPVKAMPFLVEYFDLLRTSMYELGARDGGRESLLPDKYLFDRNWRIANYYVWIEDSDDITEQHIRKKLEYIRSHSVAKIMLDTLSPWGNYFYTCGIILWWKHMKIYTFLTVPFYIQLLSLLETGVLYIFTTNYGYLQKWDEKERCSTGSDGVTVCLWDEVDSSYCFNKCLKAATFHAFPTTEFSTAHWILTKFPYTNRDAAKCLFDAQAGVIPLSQLVTSLSAGRKKKTLYKALGALSGYTDCYPFARYTVSANCLCLAATSEEPSSFAVNTQFLNPGGSVSPVTLATPYCSPPLFGYASPYTLPIRVYNTTVVGYIINTDPTASLNTYLGAVTCKPAGTFLVQGVFLEMTWGDVLYTALKKNVKALRFVVHPKDTLLQYDKYWLDEVNKFWYSKVIMSFSPSSVAPNVIEEPTPSNFFLSRNLALPDEGICVDFPVAVKIHFCDWDTFNEPRWFDYTLHNKERILEYNYTGTHGYARSYKITIGLLEGTMSPLSYATVDEWNTAYDHLVGFREWINTTLQKGATLSIDELCEPKWSRLLEKGVFPVSNALKHVQFYRPDVYAKLESGDVDTFFRTEQFGCMKVKTKSIWSVPPELLSDQHTTQNSSIPPTQNSSIPPTANEVCLEQLYGHRRYLADTLKDEGYFPVSISVGISALEVFTEHLFVTQPTHTEVELVANLPFCVTLMYVEDLLSRFGVATTPEVTINGSVDSRMSLVIAPSDITGYYIVTDTHSPKTALLNSRYTLWEEYTQKITQHKVLVLTAPYKIKASLSVSPAHFFLNSKEFKGNIFTSQGVVNEAGEALLVTEFEITPVGDPELLAVHDFEAPITVCKCCADNPYYSFEWSRIFFNDATGLLSVELRGSETSVCRVWDIEEGKIRTGCSELSEGTGETSETSGTGGFQRNRYISSIGDIRKLVKMLRFIKENY